jgi:hypothetical protein
MRETALPKLLTRRELAELFGTTANALAVQHASGTLDLPFYKRGTRVYYSEPDVLAYLERHRVSRSGAGAADGTAGGHSESVAVTG